MSAEPPEVHRRSSTTLPATSVPLAVRVPATILRALFLIALIIIVVRASSPQNERIWTAYDTPADLIRVALGAAACVWLLLHLFVVPRSADGTRNWLYFGLVGVPLIWVVALARW
jgi:hypothetical protein